MGRESLFDRFKNVVIGLSGGVDSAITAGEAFWNGIDLTTPRPTERILKQ